MLSEKVSAIDLFCGAGGLTRGLEDSGIPVGLGVDVDPACQYPYEENNNAQFLLASVENLTGSDLAHVFGGTKVKILAGCAPCQTFSTYNQKATASDKRWWLLLEFERLVKEVKPNIVTMENVPGLVRQGIFNRFVSSLQEQGYECNFEIVECEKYGLPQHRRRLVLIASKFGKVRLLEPKEFGHDRRTVRDTIYGLPRLEAGGVSKKDNLHKCSELSELNFDRILESKPGGTWRDWPPELIAECHKKKTGKTYPSVYGRMSWDQPSPTLTTQFFGFGNGRFGHPEQNRAISIREGALLQSFPRDYKFVEPGKPVKMKELGRLIGNAVPVKLGELIGKSILEHIENYGFA